MPTTYYALDGAYSLSTLCNSPNPVDTMKYPCLPSYPFINDYSGVKVDTQPLYTEYSSMNASYPQKPCAYCKYFEGTQGT